MSNVFIFKLFRTAFISVDFSLATFRNIQVSLYTAFDRFIQMFMFVSIGFDVFVGMYQEPIHLHISCSNLLHSFESVDCLRTVVKQLNYQIISVLFGFVPFKQYSSIGQNEYQ